MAGWEIGPLAIEHPPGVLDIWSAPRDGACKGTSGLWPPRAGVGGDARRRGSYIDRAFVRPEVRGRGVLRAPVAALADAAPDGTAGLFVTYLPANLGAARAWDGLGFRPFAAIHRRRLDGRARAQWRG